MSDVKDALSTLCEYVNLLINVNLTPEHLKQAERNIPDENAAETLWSTLRILSYHAAKEKRNDLDFRDYDASSAVTLHLAFLQYPAIEFYCLSQDAKHNRDALITLAWLLDLKTQDVLTAILRAKLTDGVLGGECSCVNPSESPSLTTMLNDRPLSTSAEFDNILRLNATVNLNLREINELAQERAKLISKVHAASLDVSGLPHLSVSELALTKRFAGMRLDDGGGGSCEKDRRQLREFRKVGILLDIRAKWLRKRHIFFDWMATVIREHRRCMESNPRVICTQELAAFISLLRHVIRDRFQTVIKKTTVVHDFRKSALNCPSRAHRSQCNNAEAQSWLNDLNEHQDREEESFQRNRKRLADELKEMLTLILPSIVHV